MAVVVHGGYWKAQYDRSLMTDLCIDLAAHGLAAWNVEYRRVGGGGGWPDTFGDVAACIDLLADPERAARSRARRRCRALGGRPARSLGSRAPALPTDAPGSRPRVRIAAAVSQAGVLDLALAAGLMPSSTPTRALLGDPESTTSATCSRRRANAYRSTSRSSYCTATATTPYPCASRRATPRRRAPPETRASSWS